MMYPEPLLIPMRQELTRLGIEELRTAEAVDELLKDQKGTAMVVVNSVCGCAARNARPAVAMAMAHAVTPDRATTVFAGQDTDATERARGYFVGYPPQLAEHRAAQGWRCRVHAGAPSHRGAQRAGNRRRSDGCLRPILFGRRRG